MTRPSVGSILVCQWGATMLMVNFYRVVAHKGKKTLVLRELQQRTVAVTGFLAGTVVPTDQFVNGTRILLEGQKPRWGDGYEFECRWNDKPCAYAPNGHSKFESFAWAVPWDGRPERFDHWPAVPVRSR
jgi:hypothetical protein